MLWYVGSGEVPPEYPTLVRRTPGSSPNRASDPQNHPIANVAVLLPATTRISIGGRTGADASATPAHRTDARTDAAIMTNPFPIFRPLPFTCVAGYVSYPRADDSQLPRKSSNTAIAAG